MILFYLLKYFQFVDMVAKYCSMKHFVLDAVLLAQFFPVHSF